MSDGVTHNGQPVVPYQCLDDWHVPCAGTFENPCPSSAAGRIVARAAKAEPAWRVKRNTVRVGDVYDVYGNEWVPSLRRCRVVKLVIDNDDDGVVPFYQIVVRFDDGRPDRTLSGPEIDYYLRRIV